MTQPQNWQKNAILMIDRGWRFKRSANRWVFHRNGRELEHRIVESTASGRLENMLVLLERGFDACHGGKWCKGAAKVDNRFLSLPAEKFLALVRKMQKAVSDAKR